MMTRERPEQSGSGARRLAPDWSAYRPPQPRFTGAQALPDIPLGDLLRYIDWMPFFNAWEFSGKFPDILQDKVRGPAATALWQDAQRMLETLVRERWLTARAKAV